MNAAKKIAAAPRIIRSPSRTPTHDPFSSFGFGHLNLIRHSSFVLRHFN